MGPASQLALYTTPFSVGETKVKTKKKGRREEHKDSQKMRRNVINESILFPEPDLQVSGVHLQCFSEGTRKGKGAMVLGREVTGYRLLAKKDIKEKEKQLEHGQKTQKKRGPCLIL